jgi:hypothetical protein
MKSIPEILNAVPLQDYKLFVMFGDGVQGEIDLSKWVGKGLFAAWNDEAAFESFIIKEDKKLQWNEDIEMDPDAFYLQLVDRTFEEYVGDKQLLRYTH